MKKNVLIVGGSGFVGSSLGIGLASKYSQWNITALDNLRRRGSELNLTRLQSFGITFIHGDIRNPDDINLDFSPDIIIDCSAEPSVLAGYSSPNYVLHTNLVGTINCLELARKTKADFIFLSTSRVYPMTYLNSVNMCESETRLELLDEQVLPGVSSHGISELFPLDKPRSLYGSTKLASELLIAEYADAYGIRTVVNRCGVLTGPWQMGKVDQGIFALWTASHYFKKPLQYIGYGGIGKQVRDLLHINDLIDLIDLEIENLETLQGETFNVGGGPENSLSLLETTNICVDITGKSTKISSIMETRVGDIPIFITDSRRIMQRTGWKPRLGVVETINSIYCWIKEHENLVQSILG